MDIVIVAAFLLAAYLLYGLLVRSPYKRRFANDIAADELVDGYLKPREILDPDEAEITHRVSAAFSADSNRLARNAGRDDPAFYEPHWGHTTGLVRGTLEITDVKALPKRFRVGLFAKKLSLPVVARVGMTKDTNLNYAVNRLSIKAGYPQLLPNVYAATGEANELDLLLAEGELADNGAGRAFFARDARQLDLAVMLNPPSLKTLKALSNWRNVGVLIGLLKSVAALMKPLRQTPSSASGWAGKPYYSAGPFALGDGMMKFGLLPRQAHEMAEIDVLKEEPTGPHRQAMEDWFAGGKDAVFDLCIQLAKPEAIPEPGPGDPPKAVMAAEYCDLHWDEEQSPPIKVGKLTLRADNALNKQFQWSPIQFNAWNTLAEMRPLGQLFRVRKAAHAAHSNTRVVHLYGEKPGEMTGKCPFAG